VYRYDVLPLPLSPKSLARVGLGAYGDKFLGAGQAFVSNNYAKYFSSTAARYYFDVTEVGSSLPGVLVVTPGCQIDYMVHESCHSLVV
jgi:hypothetical protein